MRLYGNDIDESTTVLEAGLDGRSRGHRTSSDLTAWSSAGEGTTRTRSAWRLIDRGSPPRDQLVRGDQQIGVVTSGTQTPFLKKAIAMAYAPAELAAPGTEVDVDIRGRASKARVVALPFYKRPFKGAK